MQRSALAAAVRDSAGSPQEQMSSLADYMQASLMLNYNKREVG